MRRASYKVTCGNGLRISIAANAWGAYSIPGAFCDPAPPEDSTPKWFTHVEVFFLNNKGEGRIHDKYFASKFVDTPGGLGWIECDGPWWDDHGIHTYVPMHIVKRLVEENGGLVDGELPPG